MTSLWPQRLNFLFQPTRRAAQSAEVPWRWMGVAVYKFVTGVLALFLAACTTTDVAPRLASGEHIYRTVSDQGLTLSVSYPASQPESGEPRSAMILLHGGGWRFGSPRWTASTASLLAENGIVALNTKYRLSLDGKTPADALEDACAALVWARENADSLGVDPGRIGFYGVSAGGHLAASTATVGCGQDIAGPDLLVLYSPAIRTSHDGWFQKLLGADLKAVDYSPFEHVKPTTPATLIVSGEEDTLTPHRYAVGFCEQMRAIGNRCDIESFAAAGHLLTRDLNNQENDFDPAPENLERTRDAIIAFLESEGFVPAID
jgi:acetyl esterase/lipase